MSEKYQLIRQLDNGIISNGITYRIEKDGVMIGEIIPESDESSIPFELRAIKAFDELIQKLGVRQEPRIERIVIKTAYR